MKRKPDSKKILCLAACLTAVICVQGCMIGPDYERPDGPMPDQWDASLSGGLSAEAPGHEAWWASFGDATLTSLIERAAADNFDLQIMEARLKEVRAYEDVAEAALWPQVNSEAAYQRSQTREVAASTSPTGAASLTVSGNGLGVSVTGNPAGAYGPSITVTPDLTGNGNTSVSVRSGTSVSAPDRHTSLYRAGFDATWELDVFGGTRREMEAARADTEGVEDARRNVFISVAGEVARNYFMLRSAQRRLETANANIAVQQQGLDLARSRFDAGLTNELDVKIAEAQLASSKSVVPALETLVEMAMHRLAVLSGKEPGALQEELAPVAPLPQKPPDVPVGLPVDILRRRPDVRQAERAVASATARIGVAEADLYPRFVLLGSLTGSSADFEGITRGANRLWSFGPGIRWPVFDGGRIRANIRVQNARQEETLVSYEKTVTTALEEVENALVAYAKEQNRLIALTEAVEANRRAVEIAKSLYANGLVSFLNVLDSERSLFAGEDQQIQSEALVLTNLVALYKALGGGWQQAYPEGQEMSEIVTVPAE